MNVHTSQLEQESALTKVQASMRDSFAQESALLQAQHQSELDQMRQQNQEQHRQEMSECFSVAQSLFFIMFASGALNSCAIMDVGESLSFFRNSFRTK